MTFLPIVDRELRVAARKRHTFWLRVVSALIALIIGGGFMMLGLVSSGGPGPFGGRGQMGGPLFSVLTWLSLGTALSAGLFFTSDCVSEEKREGTLGFLFLTDLHGYDVVLGKLLATSLRCVFGLIAIFPVLAITQLLGGVEVTQFWKTLLALLNALFISLGGGLFVSAISRDSQKALAGTLLLLLLLVFGGPIADGIMAAVPGRSFQPMFSLASPGFVFVCASRWLDPTFWLGLVTNQVIGWAMLGLACALVPRTWQQRRVRTSAWQMGWSYAWRYGGVRRRTALRRKLMSGNPVLWLACRERWQSLLIWFITAFILVIFVGALAGSLVWSAPMQMWIAWGFVGGAFTLLMYLGTASQAGRFFVEARRSGLTELLLAAPLHGRQIVQGQWRALRRMFGLPLGLFVLANTAGTFLANHATWGQLAAVSTIATVASTSGAGTNTVGTFGSTNAVSVRVSRSPLNLRALSSAARGFTTQGLAFSLGITLATTLIFLANVAALSWFGMWMGMTSKSANLATLKTLVFVQVIPWFVVSFASSMIAGVFMMRSIMPAITRGAAPNPATMIQWLPLVSVLVTCALSLGKDVFLLLMARRKLYTNFRNMAVRSVVPIQFVVPPPPIPTPPVITATS